MGTPSAGGQGAPALALRGPTASTKEVRLAGRRGGVKTARRAPRNSSRVRLGSSLVNRPSLRPLGAGRRAKELQRRSNHLLREQASWKRPNSACTPLIGIARDFGHDPAMRKSVLRDTVDHLPSEFKRAHELCFVLHDIMLQSLVAGEEGGIFRATVKIPAEVEKNLIGDGESLLRWLEAEQRFEDRAAVVLSTVFPSVLSDMLHCIYEALQSSRKAKLNITYMLIRKPLQESLFLFESILLSRVEFTAKLATNPLSLRGGNAGGPQAHTSRIQKVLETIGKAHLFDAAYIAQLRYEKCDDGFDGVCNQAMHLFTEHKAIATAPMNINFIFSGWNEKWTQWAFLYSRLPYLLSYMLGVLEHLTKDFALTHPAYVEEIDRRVAALSLLAWAQTDERYASEQLETHAGENYAWLEEHFGEVGTKKFTLKDLQRMAILGAVPGESWLSIKLRHLRFSLHARLNRWAAERDDRRSSER